MKIKILFILLLSNFALFGQDSKTFVDTNKLWSIYLNYDAEGCPWLNYSYYIKFTEETIISSKTYLKVMRSNDSAQSNWYNYGYIRETEDKKIYYLLNIQDSVEKYLFNENANVGDTLILFNVSNECSTYVIESIDSVLIGDHYRKRFNPVYGGTWIEGIGSLSGFDNNGVFQCWFGGLRELLCLTENDTLQYSNPYHSFCYEGTLDLNEVSNNKILVSIFPNPVTSNSIFKVDNLKWTNNTLDIFSYSGQKIKTISIDKQATINKSDFQSGLYIYRLITNTGLITGKFEVE